MVRRKPRQAVSHHLRCRDLYSLGNEDVVEPHQRQAGWKGGTHGTSTDKLCVSQPAYRHPVGRRGGDGVEIAAKHCWYLLRCRMPEPGRGEQRRHLLHAFTAAKPEMGVDDPEAAVSQCEFHRKGTARFPEAWQRACLGRAHRQRADQGIAVFLFGHRQRGVEMDLHAQQRGDHVGLIHPSGSAAADIYFLQRDNIGLQVRDDLGNPRRVELPVRPDAAVDVVGENADGLPALHRLFLENIVPGQEPVTPAIVPSGENCKGWISLMSYKRLLWNGFFGVALCLAAYLLYRIFSQYSLDDIIRSVKSIPAKNFVLAILATAASYLCLTGFDYLAIRSLGKKLPYRKVALASFVSLSLGHTIGFAGLSSGAFRYRYYSRWGLTLEDVTKIILFCGVTVGLGLVSVAALALVADPSDGAKLLRVSPETARLIGLAAFLVPAAYIALSAFIRGTLRVWKWSFQLPTARIALAQVLVGTVDFLFVSACLQQLLLAFGDVPFFQAVTAFALANSAILATHVPGGLGVLEATVMYVVPQEGSIGALLAFRSIYFFIPLGIGLAIFAASELRRFASKRKSKEKADSEVAKHATPRSA